MTDRSKAQIDKFEQEMEILIGQRTELKKLDRTVENENNIRQISSKINCLRNKIRYHKLKMVDVDNPRYAFAKKALIDRSSNTTRYTKHHLEDNRRLMIDKIEQLQKELSDLRERRKQFKINARKEYKRGIRLKQSVKWEYPPIEWNKEIASLNYKIYYLKKRAGLDD